MKETAIKISKEFKKYLDDEGTRNETYEDIILRMMKSSIEKEV